MKKDVISIISLSIGLLSISVGTVFASESENIIVKDCGYFYNGLASFSYHGKYGFLNTDGEVIVDPEYDYVYDFDKESGLACVFIGTMSSWGYPDEGNYGFIDTEGNVVIDLQYEDGFSFSEGLAAVEKDGKYGFIDVQENVVIPFKWDNAYNFHDGIAQVWKNEKAGYIDKEGNVISEPEWDQWSSSSTSFDGLIRVNDSLGKYGFIDLTGKLVIPCEYDYANSFSEGYTVVEVDDKYGFIDTKGSYVVDPQWDDASSFSNEIACVKKNDKYGYIDTTGKVVIEPEFDSENSFINADYTLVEKNGTNYIIDKKGNEVLALNDYDFASNIDKYGYIRVFNGSLSEYGSPNIGKYGYIDIEGDEVIPPEYMDLSFMGESGYLIGNDGTSSYVIDIKGNRTPVKASSTMDTSKKANFKSYSWGDDEELIKASEGAIPDYTGDLNGVKAHYIGYDTNVSGLDMILAFYFCDYGLYETRYILTEKHSVESNYIDDYNNLKSAITKKYGQPNYDDKSWDTSSHEDYYKGKEGDALSYGYLTFDTKWALGDTNIYMNMSADNYDISLIIDYSSTDISPGAPDYSDDF